MSSLVDAAKSLKPTISAVKPTAAASTDVPATSFSDLTDTGKAVAHNVFDKTPTVFQKGTDVLQTYLPVKTGIFDITPEFNLTLNRATAANPALANKLAQVSVNNIADNIDDTLKPYTTLSLDKGLNAAKPATTPVSTGSGITDLGKMGIGLAASIGGDVANTLVSDGFSTTPGNAISQVGSAVGSGLSFIPGVGWWVGPAVTFGSKLIGGLYNRAFGSKFFDNGARSYINRLNALNPNGSNEYIANLLATTGTAPRATYRDGWFTDKGENEAKAVNAEGDLAYETLYRRA